MNQNLNKTITLGPKLNNFVEKYVELPLQYDAKYELDQILQELLIKIYK